MRYLILILIIFNIQNAFSETDDFGDEPEVAGRKVVMAESAISKKISLSSIKFFIGVDKYLLKHVASVYDALSTQNFQSSVDNFSNNVSLGMETPNSFFILSSDRALSTFGGFILNITLGAAGTANIVGEMNLDLHRTKVSDILRFYGTPEVFFINLAIFPLTLPLLAEEAAVIYQKAEYSLRSHWLVDQGLLFVNTRALYSSQFDILIRLTPETIYENVKNKIYSDAKYFNLKRTVYISKKQALQVAYKNRSEFLR